MLSVFHFIGMENLPILDICESCRKVPWKIDVPFTTKITRPKSSKTTKWGALKSFEELLRLLQIILKHGSNLHKDCWEGKTVISCFGKNIEHEVKIRKMILFAFILSKLQPSTLQLIMKPVLGFFRILE